MPTQTSKFTLPRPLATDAFNLASQQSLIDAIDTNIATIVQMAKLTQDSGQVFDMSTQDLNTWSGTKFGYGQNLQNAPTSAWFRMLQFESSPTSKLQIAIANTGQLYIRNMTGGTFASWSRVYTSADDSDWMTATLLNGTQTFAAGSELRYRKQGNQVTVEGSMKNITSFPRTVMQLPSGFRPSRTQVVTMQSSNDSGSPTMARWIVNVDGTVYVEGKTGADPTSATWFPLNVSFFID